MPSTRHNTDPEAPLSFERYASSAGLGRVLPANLVAKRCEVLESEADCELVWWIQDRSRERGGIAAFKDSLLKRFDDRLRTRAMHRLGTRPGQVYSRSQVELVRAEIPGADNLPGLMTRGERTRNEQLMGRLTEVLDIERKWTREEADDARPLKLPVEDLIDCCRDAAADELERLLCDLCLDPALGLSKASPWWWPTMMDDLRSLMRKQSEAVRARTVLTEVGRLVHEEIEYAVKQRCLVLIEGLERIGKTFAAQAWAEMNPGRARYFQVPATTDEIGFQRAIARALGVSVNLTSKAHQLRDRVEAVLQTGQLALIADEAHFIWPQSRYRDALPDRLNWMLNALVNYRVPLILICTPQFFENQAALKRKVAWRDGQFIGRMGHITKLPDTLGDADLLAVARVQLPEGSAECHKLLVAYAKASARYLAGIDAVVRRVKYEAARDAVAITPAIVARVIKQSAMPSDAQLAAAVAKAETATLRPARGRRAAAPRHLFGGPAADAEFSPEPPLMRARETVPAVANSGPSKRQTAVEVSAFAGG